MKVIRNLLALILMWLGVTFFSVYEGEDLSSVRMLSKSGVVDAAECVQSRSLNGIRYKVLWDGDLKFSDEYLELPSGSVCSDELIVLFKRGVIDVQYYKNYHLEVEVSGVILRNREQTIEKLNSESGISIFLFIFSVLLSVIMVFRSLKEYRS